MQQPDGRDGSEPDGMAHSYRKYLNHLTSRGFAPPMMNVKP